MDKRTKAHKTVFFYNDLFCMQRIVISTMFLTSNPMGNKGQVLKNRP